MDWNHIKSFLAIVETGSLELAARKLRVSTTTVFRHIHALEDHTGARLFDRIRGHYHLTEAGNDMLAPARQIMNCFETIGTDVSGRDTSPSGLVRITAPTSFSYFLLPEYLSDFHKHFPDIQIDLLSSNQEFNMTQRYADIAVRVSLHPPEHLVGTEVRELQWGIYGAQNKSFPENPDSLLSEAFIGASGTLASYAPYKWLERQLRTHPVHHTDDLVAMAQLARADVGLACLPSDLAIPGLRLLRTLPEITANKLWVLTHPDLRNISRIRETMRWITRSLRNEPRLTVPTEIPNNSA
ncbi:LysR family transcriptional regulator [Thalassospira australica]|uniref:LysR family transcriptional regulator n=1 Tax=Thalassospira australica TaxID=1528106 RepID=UPI00051A0132|nr:LysR family transcriptional regulator [Thalassospira australica]